MYNFDLGYIHTVTYIGQYNKSSTREILPQKTGAAGVFVGQVAGPGEQHASTVRFPVAKCCVLLWGVPEMQQRREEYFTCVARIVYLEKRCCAFHLRYI